jgi:REP element-mobilizing transposase RayT
MTNHIHLIARATSTFKMSDIVRDFNKISSREIIQTILENNRESRKEWLIEMFKTETGYRFWKSGNHPIELWSNAVFHQKLNYIHQNPVVEGLVFEAEDYVFSSAIDYAGGKGLLDVVLLR